MREDDRAAAAKMATACRTVSNELAAFGNVLDNERDVRAGNVSRFSKTPKGAHFMTPPRPPRQDVTLLLESLTAGDSGAVNQLLPLVYEELHALAQRQLLGERANHSLQATALVHEAYLRLVDQHSVEWKSRAHFIAVAATAMRRILVDYARTRSRQKRGGGADRVALDDAMLLAFERDVGLLDLDDALERLAQRSPDRARIVEMRFFGGLSIEEIAAVLDSSVSTVNREWRYVRAWLYRELDGAMGPSPGGPDDP